MQAGVDGDQPGDTSRWLQTNCGGGFWGWLFCIPTSDPSLSLKKRNQTKDLRVLDEGIELEDRPNGAELKLEGDAGDRESKMDNLNVECESVSLGSSFGYGDDGKSGEELSGREKFPVPMKK